MEPVAIIKLLLAPATKLYELVTTPKDDIPVLVQEPNGIDVGIPNWARGRDFRPGFEVRAEGQFFMKCKGAQARYAEVMPHGELVMSISPDSFTNDDRVTITFDLDTYDKLVTFTRKSIVIRIKVITGKGRKATLKYKCSGYRITPVT